MTGKRRPKKDVQAKPLKLDEVDLDPENSESDRPATWGDVETTAEEDAAAYEADRPPHHGD